MRIAEWLMIAVYIMFIAGISVAAAAWIVHESEGGEDR